MNQVSSSCIQQRKCVCLNFMWTCQSCWDPSWFKLVMLTGNVYTHYLSLSLSLSPPSLCNTHAHTHIHKYTHSHSPSPCIQRPRFEKITTRHKSNWWMGNFGRKKNETKRQKKIKNTTRNLRSTYLPSAGV